MPSDASMLANPKKHHPNQLVMMLKTVMSLRSNLVGQKVCLKYAKQKENNSILWYSLCIVLLFGGRTYTKMRAHPVNRGCMWTDCQVPLCFRILHLIFTKCLWFNYPNCNVFFKATDLVLCSRVEVGEQMMLISQLWFGIFHICNICRMYESISSQCVWYDICT